jgi:hypothetical protein
VVVTFKSNPTMKKTFITIIILFFGINLTCNCQDLNPSKKQLLCKTWILSKYKESDGSMYPPLAQMKNGYTRYFQDGTFESKEQGILIKGKWTFDEKTMILTTTQNQIKDYPAKIEAKVIKLDAKEMIIEALDEEGSKLTLFLIPKEDSSK